MTEVLDSLAETTAEELRRDHLAAIEQGEIEEFAALPKEERRSLFSKIRYTWRLEDKLIVQQIKGAAEKQFNQQFAVAMGLLDQFYAKAEHRDQLTGQEIEEMLFRLSRLRFVLMPEVNQLLLDAIYAKHVSEDHYQDHWGDILDGTQGDKSAKASRESREDKYHAFFKFHIYSTADTFMKELNNFQRLLERIRDWQVRGGR